MKTALLKVIKKIKKYLSLVDLRLIDGQEYDGVVKAKEQAQQQYTEAVSRGESAGIVRYSDQLLNFLLYLGVFLCCIL